MKNASLETMKQLKLLGMAGAYEAVLGLPVNQHPGAHEMLANLMDAEQQHRSQKRMEMFLRLGKLRYRATLPDIDCSTEESTPKSHFKSSFMAQEEEYLEREFYLKEKFLKNFSFK